MNSLKTKENPAKVLPTQQEKEEWNKALRRIARIDKYRQLKELHSQICTRMLKREMDMDVLKNPKKPSDDLALRHLKLSYRAMSKLKPSLEVKMKELEKIIQEDIEQSKKEI